MAIAHLKIPSLKDKILSGGKKVLEEVEEKLGIKKSSIIKKDAVKAKVEVSNKPNKKNGKG